MTPKAINAAIDAIIARAPDLRRAGITELSVGDLRLVVGTPWIDPVAARDAANAEWLARIKVETPAPEAPPPEPVDPLNDAATYAMGGRVPGFQRPKE